MSNPSSVASSEAFIEELADNLRARRVAFNEIPVVDLAPLSRSAALDEEEAVVTQVQPTSQSQITSVEAVGDSDSASMARSIHWALANVGFMYVRNHGVNAEITNRAFEYVEAFFNLPDEEKLDLHIRHSGEALRGYTPYFGENTDPTRTQDLKEVFDVGREASDGVTRPFFGTNRWPASLPDFGDVMMAYHYEMMDLARRLMHGIALSLELPGDYFENLMKEPVSIQRLLHYPTQARVDDDSLIGIGAHTDYGCLTILAQDRVGGLQIMNRDGEWIDAPYVPETFIINIGDMLQRLTNDVYLANFHRVINISGRERYSMPFFFDVDYDTVFSPLPGCVSDENPVRYEPIVCGDHKWSRYVKSFPHLSTE